MPKVRVKIVISDNYADLLRKDIYEPVVCEIMNDSQLVFPDCYEQIFDQSHGESDFKNLQTGQMIDAKLLFQEKQCYMLAMGKEKLQKWLDSLKDEVNELFELMKQDSEAEFCSSSLYFEMSQRLKNIKFGEDVVLFMPYPFAVRYKNGVITYLTVNIFRQIFQAVKKHQPEITAGKRVYIIYPSPDDRVVLAELSAADNIVEYLDNGILAEYVNIGVEY